MRNLYLILALPLLAHCGSPPAGNEAGEAAELPAEPAATADANAEVSQPAAAPAAEPAAVAQPGSTSPCLMQGDDQLQVAAIRAVGTEPFWGAKVEGRCVTYSTPDDQQGTRVWTRYTPGPSGGGLWTGQLNGKSFQLRTRPAPGCSDGMSDERYPIAVELTVDGELRRGCAKPL